MQTPNYLICNQLYETVLAILLAVRQGSDLRRGILTFCLRNRITVEISKQIEYGLCGGVEIHKPCINS